ncbi:high mobility group, hmg1/hMg2 protein [Grosmannia clavigera kw1407]|uniref:High mobility group, hmg1/hMg2 protein n=1 Tax=Grosmannia clavigera (strain kw1407 / UAMH 11150) TaxID=655863 RepID=F0XIG6_GROCL|nr:high mobility group, hmg1/hMg2 protein [Grosmannia clavigera kw1407]EFX02514.1 high mobility group, hmg1/hMg2 protein [Grosmannia clavigera kw1407]
MWSAVRTTIGRGLFSPAVESKVFTPAARRIATASAARAPPRPRGTLCVPLIQCTESTQTRGFAGTATAAVTKDTAATTKAKKAPAKKPAAKTKVAAKKPAAKKPAKKTTAAKKKVAAKKPAEKKPRKVKTDEEKKQLKVRELKKLALLDEPTRLPERSWVMYVSERIKGQKLNGDKHSMVSTMPSLSKDYKDLSEIELQRLRDSATKNIETNAVAYKAWVESHSPKEVAEANRARAQLKRLHPGFPPAKRECCRHMLFSPSRAGKGASSTAGPSLIAAKAIAAEWKALPESERQPFEEEAKTDFERYEKEVKSVLDRVVLKSSPPSSP